MHYDIYYITGATLYISRYALGAAAIALCILLFRHSRSVGWLFLGMLFIEPFYFLVARAIHGHRLFPFFTRGGLTPEGAQNVTIQFEFPSLYIFAVIGLFLLYRRAQLEAQVQSLSSPQGQAARVLPAPGG